MKVLEDLVIQGEYSLLVQAYWSSKDQIEILPPTTEIPRLAVSSTSEEWSKTGKMSVLRFDIAICR